VGSGYLHFFVHSTSVPEEPLEDELDEEDELLLDEEPPPELLDPEPPDEVVPEEVVPLDVVVPPELLLATAGVERSFAVFSKAVSRAEPSWVSPTIAAIPTAAAMRAYSTEVTPSSAVTMRSMLTRPDGMFLPGIRTELC